MTKWRSNDHRHRSGDIFIENIYRMKIQTQTTKITQDSQNDPGLSWYLTFSITYTQAYLNLNSYTHTHTSWLLGKMFYSNNNKTSNNKNKNGGNKMEANETTRKYCSTNMFWWMLFARPPRIEMYRPQDFNRDFIPYPLHHGIISFQFDPFCSTSIVNATIKFNFWRRFRYFSNMESLKSCYVLKIFRKTANLIEILGEKAEKSG